MKRNNAKDDAVEGGEDGERPPSSQPIAPAVAGQAPPQPAGKSIAYFLRIADETREAVRATTVLSGEDEDCGFIFSALVRTHNDIINTIRDIPPWEWSGEFLRCEPELLLFLDQNRKRHPECPAFNQAHILASALSLYHRENQTPKPLTEQERTICIAANRDLVDEYSDALLRAYREIFNFLFEQGGNTAHTAVAEIIKAIVHEHEQTRQMIKETNGLVQKVLSAITKALPFLRDRHRYKVPVKVAAAAMGICTRELYRILNHKVEAPDGFPGLDNEVRFYHWVANYRKRIGLQNAIQGKAEGIRKWGRQMSVR